LLKSGTSPLPNHGEAEAAESRADFIHKLKICLKELRETRRWLLLVQRVPLIQPPDKVTELLDETEQLIRIFYSAIRTAAQPPSSNSVREDSIEAPWTLGVGRWALEVENAPRSAS
jgi:four helix bundle protein